MKRKWFVLFAVLAITVVGVFVNNQMTQAQRPERQGRGGGPGGRGRMNPTSLVDSSWVDLTFSVKVDDPTLIKARPIYQKSRDDMNKAMTEARDAGDFQGMREVMTEVRQEFKAALKEVLTEEQIAQLDDLEQERMQQMMRRGGGRPGGGGR